MGKQRQTALILGEGPTEFFYFKSLCDVFKRLTIKPDYPKHTNLRELEAKIEEGVAMGYSHIFCIIDMDTKDKEPEHSQYIRLKAKYAIGTISISELMSTCVSVNKSSDEGSLFSSIIISFIADSLPDSAVNNVRG